MRRLGVWVWVLSRGRFEQAFCNAMLEVHVPQVY